MFGVKFLLKCFDVREIANNFAMPSLRLNYDFISRLATATASTLLVTFLVVIVAGVAY